MANFEAAFQRLMKEEGVVLTNDPLDRGGLTFAGITRKFHPDWLGWKFIDAGETPPIQMVRDFYHVENWMPVHGDEITNQRVANVLFSQYVNMGANALKLAQHVLGTVADGKIGPKTVAALNAMPPEVFLDKYCIANIVRYHAIGMKDVSQRRFWPGWISRATRIAA